jgi:hypothetical protein
MIDGINIVGSEPHAHRLHFFFVPVTQQHRDPHSFAGAELSDKQKQHQSDYKFPHFEYFLLKY